eukprot:UN25000
MVEHDSYNKFDPNALQIMVSVKKVNIINSRLGYLPASLAKKLAPLFSAKMVKLSIDPVIFKDVSMDEYDKQQKSIPLVLRIEQVKAINSTISQAWKILTKFCKKNKYNKTKSGGKQQVLFSVLSTNRTSKGSKRSNLIIARFPDVVLHLI